MSELSVSFPRAPDQLLSDEVNFCLLFSGGSFDWTSTGDIDLRGCHIDMEALEAEKTNCKRKFASYQDAGPHGCHFPWPQRGKFLRLRRQKAFSSEEQTIIQLQAFCCTLAMVFVWQALTGPLEF